MVKGLDLQIIANARLSGEDVSRPDAAGHRKPAGDDRLQAESWRPLTHSDFRPLSSRSGLPRRDGQP